MITIIKGKIPFSIIPIKDNDEIELNSNFETIGNISNLTEDQCSNLVNTIFIEIPPSPSNDMGGDWDIGYVDYLNVGEYAGWQGDAGAFRHAKESLQSLLISENIWIKKWVYIPYDESCKDKKGLHLEFPGGEEYLNLPDDLILVKQKVTESSI